MNSFPLNQVYAQNGFIKDCLTRNATVTVKSIYNRFSQTGRFNALKCVKCDVIPPIFWDSDVAKWLEATAYILSRVKDDELFGWYDQAVNDIVSNQREDGYFNSYFQVYDPEKIFTDRTAHELYCAGHFFEAGVAASQYLHDDRLLNFSIKYADYIYERFYVKKDTVFITPGHQEIELALVKLYNHTGIKKYLTLAKYFIDERGKITEKEYFDSDDDRKYSQSQKPVRELTQAEGHSVRLLYLICSMLDVGSLDNDNSLVKTAKNLLDEIINKKMYVTGGMGSSHVGENFTCDYDLPNTSAYAETCASIALMLACDRLFKIDDNPVYADVLERTLYNGFLSGISLDGDKFFYVNPLEVNINKYEYNKTIGSRNELLYIPERVKVFFCSCCPPNVCRIIEQLPSYSFYQSQDTLTIAQYASTTLKSDFANVEITSNYPLDGKIAIKINSHSKKIKVKLRIPSWCENSFENAKDGYLIYEDVFDDKIIQVEFKMTLRKVYPNPLIEQNSGKVCLSYGPLVLCAEGYDNNDAIYGVNIGEIDSAIISINNNSTIPITATVNAPCYAKTDALYLYNKPKTVIRPITFIPYYAWGNRSKNDMKVWFPLATE